MGVKDNYIAAERMKELRATYGEGRKQEERKSKMRAKMHKCFSTIIRLWRGLITNMKKEAQTYKEEREQQKRIVRQQRGKS